MEVSMLILDWMQSEITDEKRGWKCCKELPTKGEEGMHGFLTDILEYDTEKSTCISLMLLHYICLDYISLLCFTGITNYTSLL